MFEYDVAISFLARDEQLALSLLGELEKTLNVFVYSKRQEELAGAEGDLAFAEVFKRKARIVIVLSRQGWGETKFTRVEREAIRSRALDSGYGFCLFVPLEKPVPVYVPAINIWYDIETYGLPPLAAVVSRMAQEQGAVSRVENALTKAARIARLEEFRVRRDGYQRSVEAGTDRQAAFEGLRTKCEESAAAISAAVPGAGLTAKRDRSNSNSMDQAFVILGTHVGLHVHLHSAYKNSLENTKLRAKIYPGHPPLDGVYLPREVSPVRSREFGFDLSPGGPVWIEQTASPREFDAGRLAEELMQFLMCVEEAHSRKAGGR